MVVDFASIPPTDALGVSSSLLVTAAGVSTPRSPDSKLAIAAATSLPGLLLDAHAAHDALSAALSARDGVVLRRGGEVHGARRVEKEADRLASALSSRLDVLSKEGVLGAVELKKYLYPNGARALTRPSGRPQRAKYVQWIGTWPRRPRQGSPADIEITAAMSNVRDAVARFGAVLDGKDTISRAADGAIDARRDSFSAWVAVFEELAAAVHATLWGHEEVFDDWLSPYTEWRIAQESRANRGNAASAPQSAPSAPAVDSASANASDSAPEQAEPPPTESAPSA